MKVFEFQGVFIAALEQVFCTIKMKISVCCGQVNTCLVNQAIDSEEYVLRSKLDSSVGQLEILDKSEVKFLPRQIGEKFPNLKIFAVKGCGLTVVRSHYLKALRNLRRLYLNKNKITTIEPNSFEDLINLEGLWLEDNLIETLDENILHTLVRLQWLNLEYNKIKFLSPTTFEIPGGKLTEVDLSENVCITGQYSSKNWYKLTNDISRSCTR